jgi:hypothetical protein
MRRAIGSAVVGLLGGTVLSGVSFGQALSAPPHLIRPPLNWSVAMPAPLPSPTTPTPLPSPPTRIWVHLYGTADLEQLRATNFIHYLRARRILAAANEICRPGPTHTYPARFKGDYPNCESAMWLTSFPPKKRLTFHLDDVGYIALVSVRVSGDFLRGPAIGVAIGVPVEKHP